jgi:hypothetical protein
LRPAVSGRCCCCCCWCCILFTAKIIVVDIFFSIVFLSLSSSTFSAKTVLNFVYFFFFFFNFLRPQRERESDTSFDLKTPKRTHCSGSTEGKEKVKIVNKHELLPTRLFCAWVFRNHCHSKFQYEAQFRTSKTSFKSTVFRPR